MTKKKIEIVVDPGNARVHDERNQQVIQESLRQLGAGRSIVIDKAGQVIAGNETYRQAKTLGLPVKIVESDGQMLIVVQRNDLAPEDERRRALAIADNRSSDLSEFNMGILANTLKAAGPELRDAMGFTEKELAQVFRQAQPKELKDPPAPPAPEEPRTNLGQLFALGPHRLLCGDATKKKDVKRLMAGQKADMVFTDPPYGMFLDTDWSSLRGTKEFREAKGTKPGQSYSKVIGDHEDFSPALIETVFTHFGYCEEIFLWGADYYSELIPERIAGAWLVWDKRLEESLDKAIGSTFELCWSKQKHKRWIARVKWCFIFGTEKEPDRRRQHPTQKPVALATWFFEKWGNTWDIVVDLYGGSGSTMLACDQLERECRMMEIDPGYCDVIIQRYAEFKEIDVEEIYASADMSHDVAKCRKGRNADE